jgi:hypothetical protein
MKRRLLSLLLISCICGGICGVAFAQEFTGNISGRVADSTRAVIPGVSVTIRSAAMPVERSTVTDDHGAYRFTLLPQGLYTVVYTLPGFRTVVREGVDLGVGKTVALDMSMEVAALSEALTVVGELPSIDLQSPTIAVNFNLDALHEIPNQRDIYGILAETPGITMLNMVVGPESMARQTPYRAYGVAGQTLITVDGINMTDKSAGAGLYIDYGALAEVQVSAAANSAEIGVPGAVITTVLKKGANAHHGEVFVNGTGANLQSKRAPALVYRYSDINAQLGGPFVQNRFWYFTSFRSAGHAISTNAFDKPQSEGGTRGHLLTRLLQNYTIKLSYQLNSTDSLTFSAQAGRKYEPYRGGVQNGPTRVTLESTSIQDSWSEVGKVEFTRILDNRTTLDMSINNFGYQFPSKAHNNKTPIQDDVTGYVSGAFATPSRTQPRRWHYNANLTAFRGKHDMKAGYMYQWYSDVFTSDGAPGPSNTTGHVTVITSNDRPTSFLVDNASFQNENELRENALFFQDKYQVTPKLTLNLGLRFDRFHSYYPEQRLGWNGPYAVPSATPAKNVTSFNTLAPRLAFIYDPFGKARTAFKGSWGRYATNTAADVAALVNPVAAFTTKYAWDTSALGLDPVIGATRITPTYVANLPTLDGGGQLTPAAVDPHLKDSYTDEYTAGIEQEVVTNVALHVSWVRKIQKNTFGTYDRLHTFSAFAPVSAVDPGPDALIGTRDDRRITIFDRLAPALPIDKYLTNKPIGDNYSTIEFGAQKRMSNQWQLGMGFDWTKRNLRQNFTEDPNTLLWGGTSNGHPTGWSAKFSGIYTLKMGVRLSGTYLAQKGEAYGRTLTILPANLLAADTSRSLPLGQGNQTILSQPTGAYYLPTVNLMNFRIQKEFKLHDHGKLQGILDIFNVTNGSTTTSVYTTTARSSTAANSYALFGTPTAMLSPRAVSLGIRYAF